jgi:ribosomal peptide maturation radical SAM protein 1
MTVPRPASTALPVEDRLLLVSMPFAALERPSLALGLLQAHCQREGVACETSYLTIPFAERIGLADYQWISNDVPYTAFAGDWLFAEALYGPRPDVDAAYVEDVLQRTWQLDDASVQRLWDLRPAANTLVEDALASIVGGEYTLVGFTSIFQQNIGALALGRRLKEAQPDVTIAFGGANWEDRMGVVLTASFPFVDLAFSGEADHSFPEVLRRRRTGRDLDGIAGLIRAGDIEVGDGVDAVTVEDLDQLPIPDFDPYFRQLQSHPVIQQVGATLLVETARGCWWGERSHCTFCGLNGATMAFRSKSPERALEEITWLRERHRTASFSVVDDILDMRYFRSLLPMLAERRLGVDFFWEVKANLTHKQVRQLRDAGVLYLQPGVESLSDHVLDLMRKGITGLRNIQLLKWCREYGVKPLWNLLYGFPGETEADYDETMALMRASGTSIHRPAAGPSASTDSAPSTETRPHSEW